MCSRRGKIFVIANSSEDGKALFCQKEVEEEIEISVSCQEKKEVRTDDKTFFLLSSTNVIKEQVSVVAMSLRNQSNARNTKDGIVHRKITKLLHGLE